MKNKKLLYMLIPLVAIVWGLIIWKVVAFQPEQQIPVAYTLPEEEQEVDTIRYELKIDYRDPFLRSTKRPGKATDVASTKRANNIKKVKINSLKGPVRPEGLIYHGLITCNEERVGLLEVSGQKKLIKEKTRIGDYQILAVDVDSLRIMYKDKMYAYGKQ